MKPLQEDRIFQELSNEYRIVENGVRMQKLWAFEVGCVKAGKPIGRKCYCWVGKTLSLTDRCMLLLTDRCMLLLVGRETL